MTTPLPLPSDNPDFGWWIVIRHDYATVDVVQGYLNVIAFSGDVAQMRGPMLTSEEAQLTREWYLAHSL